MSRAYRKWKETDDLARKAVARFGKDAPETRRALEVRDYWKVKWAKQGYPIMSPPASILEERIKAAEITVRQDRRQSSG